MKKLSGSLELASPEILAGAAVKLEELRADLSDSGLTELQVLAILTRIAGSEDSKLRSVDGWLHPGILMVPSAVFAGALSRWERVYLGHFTRSTIGQLELLARAIQRREKVEFLYALRMTVEQITAVLTMVKENRQGRLKTVKIYQDAIVSVSPVLIREAMMNHAVNIITLEF